MSINYHKIINTITSTIKNLSDTLKFNYNKHAIIQEMYESVIDNKVAQIHTLSADLEQIKKINYHNKKELSNIINENTKLKDRVSLLEDLLTKS